ncbi:hypothetical protein pYptb0043 (plasmid) [Yersinia pseudotuberculosis IP 32953]|uniref:Uncharacterized protein n=1 Tax=Yersinia pseudotuberculosis serotype I (strain IP32953) TaxID=273123 RepID=Q663B2_YERPS|nr:hypothetical protein pYptb0043 [Yersinia pseudotuberculosis IP 32953]
MWITLLYLTFLQKILICKWIFCTNSMKILKNIEFSRKECG